MRDRIRRENNTQARKTTSFVKTEICRLWNSNKRGALQNVFDTWLKQLKRSFSIWRHRSILPRFPMRGREPFESQFRRGIKKIEDLTKSKNFWVKKALLFYRKTNFGVSCTLKKTLSYEKKKHWMFSGFDNKFYSRWIFLLTPVAFADSVFLLVGNLCL